jgi:hypothetical protein
LSSLLSVECSFLQRLVRSTATFVHVQLLQRAHARKEGSCPLLRVYTIHQVLDEICQILTDKQFKGKMVVVLAGYEAQIEELLAVNPGLKSRFSERLLFPDFTAEDAVQLLKQQLGSKYSLELSEEAAVQLPGLMQQVG